MIHIIHTLLILEEYINSLLHSFNFVDSSKAIVVSSYHYNSTQTIICQQVSNALSEFSFILQSAALLILSSLTDINFSSLGWTGEKPSIPTFLFRITSQFWVSEDLDILFNSVVTELLSNLKHTRTNSNSTRTDLQPSPTDFQ